MIEGHFPGQDIIQAMALSFEDEGDLADKISSGTVESYPSEFVSLIPILRLIFSSCLYDDSMLVLLTFFSFISSLSFYLSSFRLF
jgi:hypothetical protein